MLDEVQLSGSPIQVDDLDDDFVLDLVRDSETQAREAERRKLRYAIHWAERHVVSDVLEAAHWSDCASDRELRDVVQTIGGDGTPLVAGSCVEAFATALGVSSRAAMQMMSDGLDLTYRLPLVHERVEDLRVAPWRARRIAQMTNGLPKQAAAYVDARLAPIADSCGVVKIDRRSSRPLPCSTGRPGRGRAGGRGGLGRAPRPRHRYGLGRFVADGDRG